MTSPDINPTPEETESQWRRRTMFAIVMVALIICFFYIVLGDGTPPKTSRIATQLSVQVRANYGSECSSTASGPEICTHFSPGSVGVNLKKGGVTAKTPTGIISLKSRMPGSKFVEPVCKVAWQHSFGSHGFLCPFGSNVAPGETVTFIANYPGNKYFAAAKVTTYWTAPELGKVSTSTSSTTTPTTTIPTGSVKAKLVPTALKTGKQPTNGPLHAILSAKETIRKLRNGYLSYTTPYVYGPKGNIPPTGYEVFRLNSSHKVLCRVPARLGTKVSCNLRTLKLGAGKYAFQVTYPGDVYYGTSHARGSFTVGRKTRPVTPPSTATTTKPVVTTTTPTKTTTTTSPVVTTTTSTTPVVTTTTSITPVATTTTTTPVVTTTTTTQPVVTTTSTSATTTTTPVVTTTTTTTIPAPTVPAAPLDVIATNTPGSTTATISWTAPANDGFGDSSGANITTYAVTGAPGGTCTSTGSPAPTTCIVTGLTIGNTYTFTVIATNGVGSSTQSAPSNSITITSSATVPGAPQSVTADAMNTSIIVSWAPPASDGGSPVLSYLATDGQGDTCSVTVASPEIDSCTISGLTSGTTYNIEVAATNAVGQGPFSGDPVVTLPIIPAAGDTTTSLFHFPTAVSEAGGIIWVANSSGTLGTKGSVTEIIAASGVSTVINSASFNDPGAIWSDGTDVWVTNRFGGVNGTGSISEINISTGVVTEIDSSLFAAPFSIYSNGTDAWIGNSGIGNSTSRPTLLVLDIATGDVTQVSLPNGVTVLSNTHLSSDGTYVWFAAAPATGDGALGVNTSTGATTYIPFTTYANEISSDGTDIWAVSAGTTGPIYEYNVATGVMTQVDTSLLDNPYSIYSNGTYVWVVDQSGGTNGTGSLVELNISSGAITQVNDPTIYYPLGIAGYGSDVLVTNQGNSYGIGSILEFAP